MKNWLKKLSCRHIYKDIKKEYLTSKSVVGALYLYTGSRTMVLEPERNDSLYKYKYFAVKMKCIKCSKENYKIIKKLEK